MQAVRALLLAMLMALPTVTIAQSSPPGSSSHDITLVTQNYPPLYHTAVDGSFSGYIAETLKVLCKEADLNCDFQILPTPRSYRSIQIGESQVLLTANLSMFNECCIASNWHYPWTAGFFSLKKRNNFPLKVEELAGESIVLVRGWGSLHYFYPGIDEQAEAGKLSLQMANSNYSAIQMFDAGRGTLLWGSEEFFWYMGKSVLKHRFHYKPLLQGKLVLLVRKERTDILERLNTAYQQMQDQHILTDKNILIEEIMRDTYKDAPFPPNRLKP